MKNEKDFLMKCLNAATTELARVKAENTDLTEQLTLLKWGKEMRSNPAQKAADTAKAIELVKHTLYVIDKVAK
jgi:hypothetical protein